MPTSFQCLRKQSTQTLKRQPHSLTATPAPEFTDAWQFAHMFSPQVEPIAGERLSADCPLRFCHSSKGEGG
jgi:hypothetical protein